MIHIHITYIIILYVYAPLLLVQSVIRITGSPGDICQSGDDKCISVLSGDSGDVLVVESGDMKYITLIVLFWEMWQNFSFVVWTKFYDL